MTTSACKVCLDDDKPLVALPCAHAFCPDCIDIEWRRRITALQPLTCLECKAEIPHATATDYITAHMADLLPRYDASLLRIALSNTTEARYCPTPDCPYAVLVPPERSVCPRVLCPCCVQSFCILCQQPWHRGVCREQRVDGVKNCPNCRIGISKTDDGACNTMHCGNCETDFCWLCLERLNPATSMMHFYSFNGCSQFGARRWSDRTKRMARLFAPIIGPCAIAIFFLVMPILFVMGVVALTHEKKSKPENKNMKCIRLLPYILYYSLLVPLFLVVVAIYFVCKVLYLCFLKIPYEQCKDFCALYCCKSQLDFSTEGYPVEEIPSTKEDVHVIQGRADDTLIDMEA